MYAWVVLMPRRNGIIIAEEGGTIGSSEIKRVDSQKKQFKYRKIIDYKFPFAAVAINSTASKTLQLYFNEDQSSLGFIPAYEFFVLAYNGNWGIPVIQSPAAYEGSIPDYPFFKGNEYVTDKFFNISLYINNLTAGPNPTYAYPAYEATLRLIITYDNLATL